MNNISLIGRLTKDADIKYTQDKKMVARFTMAVRRDEEHSDFIPCVAFGKTAETLNKYIHKGEQVGVEGRLQSNKYDNKEGKTIYTLDVIVNRIHFVGSKNTGPKQDQYVRAEDNTDYRTPELSYDDLPF